MNYITLLQSMLSRSHNQANCRAFSQLLDELINRDGSLPPHKQRLLESFSLALDAQAIGSCNTVLGELAELDKASASNILYR